MQNSQNLACPRVSNDSTLPLTEEETSEFYASEKDRRTGYLIVAVSAFIVAASFLAGYVVGGV